MSKKSRKQDNSKRQQPVQLQRAQARQNASSAPARTAESKPSRKSKPEQDSGS